MTKASDLPPKRYIFCNRCGEETNHVCEADHYRDYCEEDGLWERLGYRLWLCAGCERGTLERYWTYSGFEDPKTGEQLYQTEYFPERSKFHVEEKQFLELPDKLNTIYRETLSAFNNNLTVLCAVGIRALLEGICKDKGIKGDKRDDLYEKIGNMTSILPETVVKNLDPIREIGNGAVHQLTPPSLAKLRLAIEVCEDILNYLYGLIYELDRKASRLSDMHYNRMKKLPQPSKKQ